jgi:hypothetical protein
MVDAAGGKKPLPCLIVVPETVVNNNAGNNAAVNCGR